MTKPVPNDPVELRDLDACTMCAALFFSLPVLPFLVVAYGAATLWRTLRAFVPSCLRAFSLRAD